MARFASWFASRCGKTMLVSVLALVPVASKGDTSNDYCGSSPLVSSGSATEASKEDVEETQNKETPPTSAAVVLENAQVTAQGPLKEAAPTSSVPVSAVARALENVARGLMSPEDAMTLAKAAKEKIEEREMDLASRTKALAKTVADFKPGNLRQEALVVEEMKKVIGDVLKMADELDQGFQLYERSAREYKSMLTTVPDTYRKAAIAWDRFAEEEKFAELKSEYSKVAKHMRDAAVAIAAREKEIDPEIARIREGIAFVRSSATYLQRFRAFVDVLPKHASGLKREAYIEQMQTYIKAVDSLRQSIREFTSKLAENVSSESATLQLKAN